MHLLGKGDVEKARHEMRSLCPSPFVAKLKADIEKWDFTHFIMDRARSVSEGLRSTASFFKDLT